MDPTNANMGQSLAAETLVTFALYISDTVPAITQLQLYWLELTE